MDEGKLTFTPAVEIAFVKPKNQNFIAVAMDALQCKPTTEQAQRLRELDKEDKLTSDMVDGILSEEKPKEVHKIRAVPKRGIKKHNRIYLRARR
jgi:hypothetical protein